MAAHNDRHSMIIAGTDTGVGKTHVTSLLTQGLRQRGHKVWLHKPVACGDWQDGLADDPRRLRPLIADQQNPTSLCRHQWPEAASPHLAAQAAGDTLLLNTLSQELAQLQTDAHQQGCHLIIEGAGGVLVPLSSDDGTILDLADQHHLPILLVTRPHLGTLNHTLLSIAAIREHGIPLLGVVINYHEAVPDSLATRTTAAELSRLGQTTIWTECPYRADATAVSDRLTAAWTEAWHHAGTSVASGSMRVG